MKRLIRQPLAADLLLVLVILAVGEAGAPGAEARVFTIALVAPLLWRRRAPFARVLRDRRGGLRALGRRHQPVGRLRAARGDLHRRGAGAARPADRRVRDPRVGVVLAVARWSPDAPVSGLRAVHRDGDGRRRPRTQRAHAPRVHGLRSRSARPSSSASATSSAGSPSRRSAPGSRARCTTSSPTTCR